VLEAEVAHGQTSFLVWLRATSQPPRAGDSESPLRESYS